MFIKTIFKKSKNVNKNAGFTLIELLVSIAIMGIIVGIGGDIFATLIRAYRKAEMFSLAETKGNTALTLIEQDIRSAISVDTTTNSLTVYLPSSSGGTISRQYTFTECSSGGSKGTISLNYNGSTKALIDTTKTDLLGSSIAIKRMNVGGSSVNYVTHTSQSSGDIQYDLVTVSFALNVGGTDPCNNPLVTSYFQTTVNLRGGLPY